MLGSAFAKAEQLGCEGEPLLCCAFPAGLLFWPDSLSIS